MDHPDPIILACPSCFAANRVPANRLDEAPKCGKCSTPLLSGEPIALGDDSLDTFLSRSQMPVLVDFWAAWCGPCRAMAPAFAGAAAKLRTRVRFAKVDTEQAPVLSSRFAIRSIPTLILFQNGQEIKRISGALDEATLTRFALQ